MTLIELLVVISIMAVLTAIAIPTMRPAMEQRRIRETARAVNVYLGAARNRALETGRPAGVMIHRVSGLTQCAMSMDHMEVPPPYAGESLTAAATVQLTGYGAGVATLTAKLSDFNANLVNVGDYVQFNNQGPWYLITNVGSGQLTLRADTSQGQLLPWSTSPSLPVPYKILRRPVKAQATPLQLPAGAVIDLEASGTDTMAAQGQSFGTGTAPIVLTFSPNGSVDRVYVEGVPYPATEPIYLLIGKRERVPASIAPGGLANYQDLHNLWVAINPQTGLVTSAEVAVAADNTTGIPRNVLESREFARKNQSVGGR